MLTLYHLNVSHFSEKARWALDYKGLPYRSKLLTPGFHILTTRRVAGTSTVPVLVDDESGSVVSDSTDILHYLDRIRPDPPLFPADADGAAAVAGVEDLFDTGWGSNASSVAYCSYVNWPGQLRQRWQKGLNGPRRVLLRAAMPVLVRGLRRRRGLSPETRKEFLARAMDAYDQLETILHDNGGHFMVGDAFSAADLTGAALLGPFVAAPGSPWEDIATASDTRGFPPADLVAFRQQVSSRPLGRWATRIWDRYRRS